jgi:hypothetical protein
MELSQIDGHIFVADCPGLALGPHLKRGKKACGPAHFKIRRMS